MSKNKKKRLFALEKPQISADKSQSNDFIPDKEIQNEDIYSDQYQKIVKKELFSVLFIIVIIGALFVTLEITNKRNNWISSLSNSILSRIVRNY
ncbi:MAG: hypothetical protein V1907_01350 [Candidatus Kerfeldbacteria bacterium]